MHPRSKDWHMIDYMITWRRDIKDISRTFHGTCFLSDHALLHSKASFRLAHRKLRKSVITKRNNVLPLKKRERREEICGNLEESLNTVEITDDIEISWRSLRDVVYSSSFEILGPPVCKHQDWFDDNNESVKKLIKQIDDRNSSVKHQAYKKCKNEVQTALCNMQDSW